MHLRTRTRLRPVAVGQLRLDRLQTWSKQSGAPLETVYIGTSDYNKKIPAAIDSKKVR